MTKKQRASSSDREEEKENPPRLDGCGAEKVAGQQAAEWSQLK
jgi:hypothetical protein